MDGFASVSHLSVRYTGQHNAAVDDISMSFSEHSHCAILGPSGAGKSTLLQALAGILSDQHYAELQGSIIVNGLEIVGSNEVSAFPNVVLLPQDPSVVFSDLVPDVGDEIRLTLQQAGIPQEQWEQRVHQTLHACGIGVLHDRSPRSLSGGEQQMSALAILLAAHPKLLCLDEPCISLDQVRQVEVSRLVYRTLRTSAVVMSESTLTLPAIVCDQFVVLDGGRTLFSGTREDFWDNLDSLKNSVEMGGWLETRQEVGSLTSTQFERLLEGLL